MIHRSVFHISNAATPEIVDLLSEVVLGTTGIRYKHLDTAQRVHTVDNPLFFYLKRRDKVLANLTFCQRDDSWYIRYFAFRTALQRSTDTKLEDTGNSLLKREIENFFQAAFEGGISGKKVNDFYAFIDPKNDRSKWMSRNFNFNTVATLSTQTFSRWFSKQSQRFSVVEKPSDVDIQLIIDTFGNHTFFCDYYLDKDPMAFIKDDQGEILAFARLSIAHWHIESLGGTIGQFKARLLSKTPILNRLVNPNYHTFSVPDSVYVKGNDPKVLEELFESIIAYQQSNMLIWWVDNKEPLYKELNDKVKWGPLHTILGVSPVDVVHRNSSNVTVELERPIYVIGIDAI